jgi:hypothetical protein
MLLRRSYLMLSDYGESMQCYGNPSKPWTAAIYTQPCFGLALVCAASFWTVSKVDDRKTMILTSSRGIFQKSSIYGSSR